MGTDCVEPKRARVGAGLEERLGFLGYTFRRKYKRTTGKAYLGVQLLRGSARGHRVAVGYSVTRHRSVAATPDLIRSAARTAPDGNRLPQPLAGVGSDRNLQNELHNLTGWAITRPSISGSPADAKSARMPISRSPICLSGKCRRP